MSNRTVFLRVSGQKLKSGENRSGFLSRHSPDTLTGCALSSDGAADEGGAEDAKEAQDPAAGAAVDEEAPEHAEVRFWLCFL